MTQLTQQNRKWAGHKERDKELNQHHLRDGDRADTCTTFHLSAIEHTAVNHCSAVSLHVDDQKVFARAQALVCRRQVVKE